MLSNDMQYTVSRLEIMKIKNIENERSYFRYNSLLRFCMVALATQFLLYLGTISMSTGLF